VRTRSAKSCFREVVSLLIDAMNPLSRGAAISRTILNRRMNFGVWAASDKRSNLSTNCFVCVFWICVWCGRTDRITSFTTTSTPSAIDVAIINKTTRSHHQPLRVVSHMLKAIENIEAAPNNIATMRYILFAYSAPMDRIVRIEGFIVLLIVYSTKAKYEGWVLYLLILRAHNIIIATDRKLRSVTIIPNTSVAPASGLVLNSHETTNMRE
jgi:hypothetical protein